MEGFLNIRVRPWLRRLVTRALAIVPAFVVIAVAGSRGTLQLLLLSQVVLSLQLPFAMFPLLHFASSRKRMGGWKAGGFLTAAGWASALLITVMDLYGLPESLKAAWQVIVGG